MLARGSRILPKVNRYSIIFPYFEPARQTTNQWRSIRRLSSSAAAVEKEPADFAFAFDIDGVLLRSAAPIPGASHSLTYLQEHHIPFILLTNGGGKHESERVSDISKSLSLSTPLTTENFIQSHTPMADFLHTFPHRSSSSGSSGGGGGLPPESTILVLGGEGNKCRLVAESYGFQNVITPADILAAYPEIWPFSSVFSSYYSSFAQSLPLPLSSPSPSSSAASLKIDAIFVFHDPRDWALDMQLILDLLLSDAGHLGTVSARNGDARLPNHGYQQQDQPPLFFSNPDLLWAAGYHLPRLGQGGFRHALEGVWRRLTDGAELRSTVIGKPSLLTYAFAEKRLKAYRRGLVERTGFGRGAAAAAAGRLGDGKGLKALRKVYMVGDNPESDIVGANNYRSRDGTEWVSVLVKTGVFGGEGDGRYDFEKRPELKPKVVVEHVRGALDWALRDSGWEGEEGGKGGRGRRVDRGTDQ